MFHFGAEEYGAIFRTKVLLGQGGVRKRYRETETNRDIEKEREGEKRGGRETRELPCQKDSRERERREEAKSSLPRWDVFHFNFYSTFS